MKRRISLFALFIGIHLGLNVSEIEATHRLPDGKVGEEYYFVIPCRGGIPPYSFFIKGKLPKNLSLDKKNGIIHGKLVEKGKFKFMIAVKDQEGKFIQEKVVLRVQEKSKSTFADWIRWLGFLILYIMLSESSEYLDKLARRKIDEILKHDSAKEMRDPETGKVMIVGGIDKTVSKVNSTIIRFCFFKTILWIWGFLVSLCFAYWMLKVSLKQLLKVFVCIIALYFVFLRRRFGLLPLI